MRVLFLTGEYPPLQGGVGDYTRLLGQSLCSLGVEVHVLTGGAAALSSHSSVFTPSNPVVHRALTTTGWGLWSSTIEAVRMIRPQVVHIQYQSAAFGLQPAINFLPRRLGWEPARPRVVTTFHDLRVPYLFPKAGPLRWWSVLELVRASDAAVLTNPSDWLQLAGTRLAPRLHPIPIGSNISRQPPDAFQRAVQRARLGAGPDDWLLAYFGFLNANKGGETLVRTLAELVRRGRPVRLVMVGGQVGASDPTNAAYLAYVRRLIADLGLDERVYWTGFTSPEEVSANLLAADCAVLPYREGASLRHGSLMAALAHGMAIITTQVPAPVRAAPGPFPALEDGVSALLVYPDDPAGLAQAVERVMQQPDLRSCLSHEASQLAGEFTWEHIAERHLSTYRTLGAS